MTYDLNRLQRLSTPEQYCLTLNPRVAIDESRVLGRYVYRHPLYDQDAIEAQAKQALAQYEKTVLTAFREVEDSLVAVRTARVQSEAQMQQVAALMKKLETTRPNGG